MCFILKLNFKPVIDVIRCGSCLMKYITTVMWYIMFKITDPFEKVQRLIYNHLNVVL